ncbi:hypothetical protein B566_EDAN016036 [Ephemera danica]|nr:hypothetical protein B566_EDAN016036 [Ephemera danica]
MHAAPAPPSSTAAAAVTSSGNDARQRRKSGDDILHASPSRKPALFDAFRPRSNNLCPQHSIMSASGGSSPASGPHPHSDANQASELRPRPRSGSDSSKGAVSKVMDMFRYRSHSAVSAEDKRKAVSCNYRHNLFCSKLCLHVDDVDKTKRI